MTKIDTANSAPSTAPSAPGASHRIHDAAQKFEAVLLGELLKPLAKKDENGESQGEGSAMQGYGVEALAGSLAQRGGLGFAHMMEMRFEKTQKNISSQG